MPVRSLYCAAKLMPAPFFQQAITSPETLGAAIRARRKALGLTIEDVRELTGAGNRFLVELEQGKPTVRLDMVLVVLRALDGELSVGSTVGTDAEDSPAALLRARRQARLEKVARDRALRRLHQRAARLLSNAGRAPLLIEKASATVSRWEAQQTCSPNYIERWRHILANPSQGMKDEVLAPQAPYGLALMQNSPFGFLLAEDAKRKTA